MRIASHSVMKNLSAFTLLFLVLVTSNACKKDSHPSSPATGSLQDADGSCDHYLTHGAWYNGIPAGSDTSYIEINVNVKSPGSYRITSDKQNGVTFSASGNFTDTGLNKVRLRATGTFINYGTTNYNISFDSSFCGFQANVRDSVGLSIPDNTWRFTGGGQVYTGSCSATIYYLKQTAGGFMQLYGSMAGFTDTSLAIHTAWGADQYFSSQPYPTSIYPNEFTFTTSPAYAGAKASFAANTGTVPAVIDIVVKSLTTDYDGLGNRTEIAICTFNGTARDPANNSVPITNAVLKLVNPTVVASYP